ncbi:MAG TPA: YceD family protein [Ktedonobacterales bacterium]|jgi:uncharacterized protein
MIYNVAQLLKAPVGTAIRLDLDPEDGLILDEEHVRLVGDVAGQVRLHRTNQGILVDGTASAPVELQCDRCLEPFTTTITFPLREQFYPTIEVNTGVPLPATEDDLGFAIDPNHTLDSREAIRQNLLVALPIRAICREDCAGLCAQCGQNLNVGTCDCVPDTSDERFAPLRALLDGGR